MDNNQNNPQEVPQVKSVDECRLNDADLIEKSNNLVSELAKTGGRSWSLSVPVNFNRDPDMIFSRLGMRLKDRNARIAELEKQNAVYREALEEINEIVCDVRISSQPKVYSVIRIAEQALKSKE